MTYEERLLDPRWQKKKGEILTRDNHTCRSCGSKDITLHAHHIFYVPDTDPWDYKDDALITYCEICHNTEHLIGNTLRQFLLELIRDNPPLIHLVAQLCVLSEKVPDFVDRLRKFMKKEMETYYKSRKQQLNG
jgi:hypothetical protein